MFPGGSLPPLRATTIVAGEARGERGMALACSDDISSNSNQVHTHDFRAASCQSRSRRPDWYKVLGMIFDPLAPRRRRLRSAHTTNAGVYVCLLAAYRGLYVLNWVWKYYTYQRAPNPLVYISAAAQAALYLIFVFDRVARCTRKRARAASSPMRSLPKQFFSTNWLHV